MNYNELRKKIEWIGLVSVILSLTIISYVKWKFTFDSGDLAQTLVLISVGLVLISLVFGILSFPNWQGIVTLIIFVYTAYLIFFTTLYALS